jgi:Fe-Mn family superoxide dismutase
MNKREFIKNLGLGIVSLAVIPALSCKTKAPSKSLSVRKEPFALAPLPYAYDALEPHIDMVTMTVHHSKHHAAYINKLNEAVKGTPYEKMTLDTILQTITESDNPTIRNNGGGHYNHQMFWESLTPQFSALENGLLQKAIIEQFGSFDQFKVTFIDSAKSVFGSGWTWLYLDGNKKLMIGNSANQDNPLMTNIVKSAGTPILGLDIWEHAYYLRYQNRRPDYITAFFNVIDWKKVDERFRKAIQ